jgi:cobinamide kinase/cobinamide phosphate guanyltransferase
MRTLIVGGARSGKSRYAEAEARASGLAVVYVATAQVAMSEADPEMAARIVRHRARRPHDWVLIEEPLGLAETLARQAARSRFDRRLPDLVARQPARPGWMAVPGGASRALRGVAGPRRRGMAHRQRGGHGHRARAPTRAMLRRRGGVAAPGPRPDLRAGGVGDGRTPTGPERAPIELLTKSPYALYR